MEHPLQQTFDPGPGQAIDPEGWLRCAETGRLHAVLPEALHADVEAYGAVIDLARNAEYAKDDRQPPADAFTLDARGHALTGACADQGTLLPSALRASRLLNRGLKSAGGRAGTIRSSRGPNTLFDPRTGFAAAVSLRAANTGLDGPGADREVVIAFGPLSSQGGWLMQATRCLVNLLGFSPPANFQQAAVLTRQVKEHLEMLNATLPSAAPKYTLRVTGHSMGGALATYAALRNEGVTALVFNPMRLGALARAAVGRPALESAAARVTEVVVKQDWLSDNAMLARLRWNTDSLGALGTRYFLPTPTDAQVRSHYLERYAFSERDLATSPLARFALRRLMGSFSVHKDYRVALAIQRRAESSLASALPGEGSVAEDARQVDSGDVPFFGAVPPNVVPG